MPKTPDPVLAARSNLANSYRRPTTTPAERKRLQTELTAAKVERAIQQALEAAPPLTDQQRARLAALLSGGAK